MGKFHKKKRRQLLKEEWGLFFQEKLRKRNLGVWNGPWQFFFFFYIWFLWSWACPVGLSPTSQNYNRDCSHFPSHAYRLQYMLLCATHSHNGLQTALEHIHDWTNESASNEWQVWWQGQQLCYRASSSVVGRIVVIGWVRLTTLSKFIWFLLSESVEDFRSARRSNIPLFALKEKKKDPWRTYSIHAHEAGRTASPFTCCVWLSERCIQMSYKDFFFFSPSSLLLRSPHLYGEWTVTSAGIKTAFGWILFN